MTQIKKEVAMNTATKRVLELFENTGMAIDPFEKAVGLAEGTIKNLKNHKYNASADTICRISEYFDITTDYIMGYADFPKSPTSWHIFIRIMCKLNKSIDMFAQEMNKPTSYFIDWKHGKEPNARELWEICNCLGLKTNPFTTINSSTNLIKRPNYDVSDKFLEDYMNLLNDKHFANIAKVYNEFDEEYQIQIYTFIVTLATKVGLNVAKIVE